MTILTSPEAGGHTWPSWFRLRWIQGNGAVGGDVQWFFTSSVPTGAWRDRIRGGVAVWNRGQSLRWVEIPPLGNYDPRVCVENRRGVHVLPLRLYFPAQPPAAAAVTHTCTYSNTARLFTIAVVFDTEGVNWSTESGRPPTNDHTDVQSFAAHELGHASGFVGHWGADVPCNQDIHINTMCGVLLKGLTWWRDLNLHDTHTFDAAY